MEKKLVKKLRRTKSPTTALILAVLFGIFVFIYLEEMKKFWVWFIVLFFVSIFSTEFGILKLPLLVIGLVSWGIALHDAVQLE